MEGFNFKSPTYNTSDIKIPTTAYWFDFNDILIIFLNSHKLNQRFNIHFGNTI